MYSTIVIIYIVFCHFGLCSSTKLGLRDIAFAMQLSFHVSVL